jgi:ABC-2 type transport system permease protein
VILPRLLAVDLLDSRRRLSGRGGKLVVAGLLLFALLFAAAECYFFESFLDALDRAGELAPDLARQLLERTVGAAAAVALAMLLTSNLVAALGSFFRAEDLETLLASPVDETTLVLHRFVRAALPASLPVIGFLIPVAATLAFHHRAGPAALLAYAALLAGGLTLALLSPAALGAMTTILVVRWVPIRFASRIILGAGAVAAIGGVVALRLLRPERLASPLSALDLAAFATALEIPGEGRTPSSWMADLLLAAVPGGRPVAPSLTGLALVALASVGIGGIVVRATWRRAFARSREESIPLSSAPPLAAAPSRYLPGLGIRSAALLDRELRGFVRDPSRWSQLALLAGLLAVYFHNLRAFDSPDPLSRLLLYYVDLGTIGFVVASVSLRFAFPAVSSEAGGIVLLRVSPVPAWHLLAVKLAVVTLPSLLLSLVLVAATNAALEMPREIALFGLLAAAAMGIALPAFSLGAGARFPRFDAADPAELALSPAGIATMMAGLAYIAAVVFLACRPLHRLLLGIRGGSTLVAAPWEAPVAALAIVALSALVTVVPMRVGLRAVERGE